MGCGMRQTYVTQDTLALGQLGDGATRAVDLWPQRDRSALPPSAVAFLAFAATYLVDGASGQAAVVGLWVDVHSLARHLHNKEK